MTQTEHDVRVAKALAGDRDELCFTRYDFPRKVDRGTRDVIAKSISAAEHDALQFLDPHGTASPDELGLLLASHRDPGLAEAYRVAVLRGIA